MERGNFSIRDVNISLWNDEIGEPLSLTYHGLIQDFTKREGTGAMQVGHKDHNYYTYFDMTGSEKRGK